MNMYDSFSARGNVVFGFGQLVVVHRIIKSLSFRSELAVAVSNVVISWCKIMCLRLLYLCLM